MEAGGRRAGRELAVWRRSEAAARGVARDGVADGWFIGCGHVRGRAGRAGRAGSLEKRLRAIAGSWYAASPSSRGVAERFKAAVLKTVVRKYRGFESLLLCLTAPTRRQAL